MRRYATNFGGHGPFAFLGMPKLRLSVLADRSSRATSCKNIFYCLKHAFIWNQLLRFSGERKCVSIARKWMCFAFLRHWRNCWWIIGFNRTFCQLKVHLCVGQAPTLYRALFMKHLGMSAGQIGLIWAVDRVFGIVAGPVAGVVSDKVKKPRLVNQLILLFASLLCAATFFIPTEECKG